MKWKGYGRKRPWSNLRYCPRVFWEGLRKPRSNLGQPVSWSRFELVTSRLPRGENYTVTFGKEIILKLVIQGQNRRHSSVGLVTALWTERPRIRFRVPAATGTFLSSTVYIGPGTRTMSYTMGIKDCSQVVNQPGREADNSPASSTEIKTTWSCTSIPTCVFMACYVKLSDMLTFGVMTLWSEVMGTNVPNEPAV
jgi:hypothetical protein